MSAGAPSALAGPPVVARSISAGELLTLTLVAASPWALGCVSSAATFGLTLGLVALLGLWAAAVIHSRRLVLSSDLVFACLLGLVLVTAFQLVPLPVAVVRLLTPETVRLHELLLPERSELLPGESDADGPARSAWVRLSLAPSATEELLARLLALLLTYVVVRNFVAPGASFRRLAGVSFVLGVGLSVLALAQALSGPRDLIYWRIQRPGQVFGPFGNKNHFAFQLYLPLGLSFGWLVSQLRHPGGWRTPLTFALAGGLGLMLTAVVFSQSRGAIVAGLVAVVFTAVVARWLGGGDRDEWAATLTLLIVVGMLAAGLTLWFGWRGVVERLATLWGSEADNRTEDWASVWPLVLQFPWFGVGGGALIHAEHLVRTRPNLGYQFNTMDNDYYEALVEGGVVRLVLTVGLAVAAVGTAVAGYRRTRSPLLLGCVFGLAALAVHSAWDFGLHIPSVALLAAVATAYTARAAAGEPVGASLVGRPAVALALLFVVAGVLVAWADWRAYRVDQLLESARRALAGEDPERYRMAARALTTAVRLRPNDPEPWNELARVYLLSGGGDESVRSGLWAARQARACLPLSEQPHLILGAYAGRFVRSEPPEVHFARAKRVAGFDADVWYASGIAAAERGDWTAAAADWRQALLRSPDRLADIVRRCSGRLAPVEIRAAVLPDDPAVWFAAAAVLFPDAEAPGRRDWLGAVADRWAVSEPATPQGYRDWAVAARVARGPNVEERVWQRAVERFPEAAELRDGWAAWLEAEERYAEAVPLLDWLVARHPQRGDYRERLAAARHALQLQADIDRP